MVFRILYSFSPPTLAQLASSIHAIHRPLIRSRRNTSVPLPIDEEDRCVTSELGDDAGDEDFERTPRPPHMRPSYLHQSLTQSAPEVGTVAGDFPKIQPTRVGSMTTVRLQRRAGLAKKLKEVFELDAIEEVWAGTLTLSSTIFLLIG